MKKRKIKAGSLEMINIAIIGLGYWGPNFVRNFSQIKGVCLKYTCDLSSHKAVHIKKLYPEILTKKWRIL